MTDDRTQGARRFCAISCRFDATRCRGLWRGSGRSWRVFGYIRQMLRTSLERLFDARGGRMWSGHDAMAFCPDRHLVGLTFPRLLSSDSLLPAATVVERLVRERREERAVVLDVSRVAPGGCDEAALSAFQRFVVQPLAQHPDRVRFLALVGGEGLSQCALVGAVVAARPSFSWALSPSLEAALRRVSEPPPSWVAEVVSAVKGELTPLGLVSRVRAVVGDAPTLSMAEVAKRLSLAPRTLQRALSAAATSFHDERLEVRLELAASRLTRTNQKVSAIAREVGYGSLPHFLSVFRARFGASPREFRARHARAGAW